MSHGIEDHERAWFVAGQQLAAAAGEPVDTVVRPIGPSRDLPRLLDGWLDEYQPDVVFLKVTWYWYAYESVPRRIERLLGRAGRPIATASIRASKQPRLASNPAFKLSRRIAHRVIGGDTPYNSAQVMEVMEACIRMVASRENIVLVVKGTGGGRVDEEAVAGFYERFTKRRIEVEGGIEQLCKSLRVSYVGTGPKKTKEQRDLAGGDGMHKRSATGQYWMGMQEGMALAEAWLAAHPAAVRLAAL